MRCAPLAFAGTSLPYSELYAIVNDAVASIRHYDRVANFDTKDQSADRDSDVRLLISS